MGVRPGGPLLSLQERVTGRNGHTHSRNNNHDCGHILWKVSLPRSGKKWALDLTQAQYGWTERFDSWDQYERMMCAEVWAVKPFGSHRKTREKLAQERPGMFEEEHSFRAGVSERFLCGLQEYFVQEGWTIEAMLRLPEEEFSSRQKKILEECGRILERVVAASQWYEAM